MMELWYDAHDGCDLWIEPLPEPVVKKIVDVRFGDVEFDGNARTIYRDVRRDSRDAFHDRVVWITYDALFNSDDIEESAWRRTGQWGVLTSVTVHARVVYIIGEEDEL